ncbi:MAG: 1-deoxy-D-xylulose-5-phosphate synthase [Oscillospiraceae bacterium]|nr:1-deoxy-D-xylulose-5-phosphate synthase [Oscillospiraceae bacterium]
MGNYRLLEKAGRPGGLDSLDSKQLVRLCREIRAALIEGVSRSGGHLASNLGVVELTVAIHRIFDSPIDQILWDVGHQCYTHKLLTGRLKDLHTLRRMGGIGGFPRPDESIHDAFIAGHASTALSAACGLIRGKELAGEPGHVVAVVGDGALTGGMAYEGLNNLAQNKNGKAIVILNDNKMSISKNVGGLTRHLTFLRTNASYYKLKDATKHALGSIPYLGGPVVGAVGSSLALVKNFIYQSDFFENLGYHYMGPVDGHDLTALQEALARAKSLNRPVLLHVETIKGKGYGFAESNPGAYHGVSSFDPKTGGDARPASDSFSDVFGRTLTRLAEEDGRICAVTAAMKRATGLGHFSARFGKDGRFFDVGIAEGHAVTFSAGLAAKGLKPVLAVFSTFLQRGYDQLIHDCAIEPKDIVLAVDRAGLVGEDGETHQGIFDAAYLTGVPGLQIYSPATYRELEHCIAEAICQPGISAVRYPRGGQPTYLPEYTFDRLDPVHLDCGDNILIVSYGRIFEQVSLAHKALSERGVNASLLKLTKIWPLEEKALAIARAHKTVLFVEEGIRSGGVGEHMIASLALGGYKGKLGLRAIDNRFVPAGSVPEQMKLLGLDAASLADWVLEACE